MNRSGQKGFTLIEILIAVVVFSIVITLLLSSFRAFMLSSKRVKDELTDSSRLSTVFSRIRQDLQSVFLVRPPRYTIPETLSDPDLYRMVGEKENIGYAAASTLMFSSLAHTDISGSSRPGAARIAYYLKENENGAFDLHRSDFTSPYPEEIRSCIDPVLCRDLTGFEITYIDVNGDEYSTWDSESAEFKYAFPVALRFNFSFGNGETLTNFVISVDIPVGRAPIE